MTVTIIFAGSDGYLESSNANYTTASNGSGVVANTSDAIARCGQWIFGVYLIDEACFQFDTSSIPDTDLVSNVDMDLWLDADNTTTDFVIRVKEGPAIGAAFNASDWVAGSNLASLTSVTSTLNTATWGVVGAYKTFSGTAPFNTVSNMKTGLVDIMVISAEQQSLSPPTASEVVEFSTINVAGTTQDPKITITSAATSSRIPYTSTPFRVWRAPL